MRNGPSGVVAAVMVAALAGTAASGPIEVIYEKRIGDPKAVFPGAVDLTGAPEAATWKAFEDLSVSPDGSRWAIRSRSSVAGDHDVSIVTGAGTAGSVFAPGGILIHEGRPAPTTAGTDGFVDFIASGFVRYDDSNRMVFGVRARTTQTGSTASPDAMRAFTWDGTTLALAFKQLDLYTGLMDTGVGANISGDETVGNSAGSYHLLNDGRVGSQDTTVNNLASTRRPVITYNRTQFHQSNVTAITALGGVGTVTWTTLNANSFMTTPDGAHWWAVGNAGSPALEVLVYDGAVVLQANSPVSTSGLNMGDILQTQMAPTGTWIARGDDNSGTTAAAPDWVVRDGVYLAKTGDPITPGSTELWGDTIFAVAINCTGDYVIVGDTDNANLGTDNVIVLNGVSVVMREGDPVDLNGNGMFDDNVFIGRALNTNAAFTASTNQPNMWWLSNDRVLHGFPMLVDGAGVELNTTPAFGSPNAFVRVALPCRADFNVVGGVSVQDIFDFLAAYFANGPGANFNCVGGVTVQDIFDFLAAYFTPC